jgi:hypothetical protein
MKSSNTKPAGTAQTPVFPKTPHRLRPSSQPQDPGAKPPKRDNIFSQSRDIREDRGTRQIKTSHNSGNFSHESK